MKELAEEFRRLYTGHRWISAKGPKHVDGLAQSFRAIDQPPR